MAWTEGNTLASYLDDELLHSAVERQLVIVGEALSSSHDSTWRLRPEIPEFARIVGLRNVLVQGYGQVDDSIVWGIIDRRLRQLRETLYQLAEQPD